MDVLQALEWLQPGLARLHCMCLSCTIFNLVNKLGSASDEGAPKNRWIRWVCRFLERDQWNMNEYIPSRCALASRVWHTLCTFQRTHWKLHGTHRESGFPTSGSWWLLEMSLKHGRLLLPWDTVHVASAECKSQKEPCAWKEYGWWRPAMCLCHAMAVNPVMDHLGSVMQHNSEGDYWHLVPYLAKRIELRRELLYHSAYVMFWASAYVSAPSNNSALNMPTSADFTYLHTWQSIGICSREIEEGKNVLNAGMNIKAVTYQTNRPVTLVIFLKSWGCFFNMGISGLSFSTGPTSICPIFFCVVYSFSQLSVLSCSHVFQLEAQVSHRKRGILDTWTTMPYSNLPGLVKLT